jgi:hypothetical protein
MQQQISLAAWPLAVWCDTIRCGCGAKIFY